MFFVPIRTGCDIIKAANDFACKRCKEKRAENTDKLLIVDGSNLFFKWMRFGIHECRQNSNGGLKGNRNKVSFMRIMICGLNGAGKSTLGKALAEKLHFHFIDIENLYFPKEEPDYIYASPRTREEVEELLLHEMETHENFIFAFVRGDYGKNICSFFQYAVLLEVPRDVRLQRVKKRSFKKFGSRMLLGGRSV